MNLTLYITTLKLSQWAILSWAIVLVLYGVFVVWIYGSVEQATGLEEYIDSMPDFVKEAIGLTDELVDSYFTAGGISFDGYLATEYISWWPIMLGVYAVMVGSGIVAREVERGTIEVLLSQPVPRYVFVATKFAAFITVVAILTVFSVVGIVAGLPTSGQTVDILRVSLAAAVGGLAVVTIAAYSLLLSCWLLDPRKAMAVAGGLTAGLYILSILGPVLGPVDWLQKLSLFYYFKPLEILFQGTFPLSGVLVYVGVAVACFVASLVVFQRRRTVV